MARIQHSSISWNKNVGSQNKYDVRLVYCNCTSTVINIMDNKALSEYDLLLDYLQL